MLHTPVLLDAVLEALRPAARLLDGTLGAGGHSAALLDAGAGELLGLDVDPQALALARVNLARFGSRAHIAHASYAAMTVEAARLGWDSVDGILLDLGLSSMQLDTPERGFAFRHEGPLDMRFDPGSERSTAADLVNHADEDELTDLFRRYGEDPNARRLARAICAGRPFDSTRALAEAIERAAPRRQGDSIHPATRVFQALRIAVNEELAVLERALPQAVALLRPGGRLAIISFHSLEDRLVKQFFKLESADCICPPRTPVCVCGHRARLRLLTRKPLVAAAAEIADNPRSRSAKLRVAEKLA
jgi:16S rRNA (cytosine1402-N4)-methyltransferase